MTRAEGDIVGPVPDGRDADAYDRLRRRVLWSLPLGLYVLGARAGSHRHLMTISWVTQVALEPKLIGVGVEQAARTHQFLLDGDSFALSLLARRDRAVVRHFVKPLADDEFAIDGTSGRGTVRGVAVGDAPSGAPVLVEAAAWIDCQIRHRFPLGSHTWFVGEVVDVGLAGPDPAAAPDAAGDDGILRMEDTRMNYGG
jgi:flavin reductase (DIM6/NTAB) family NADH-FMN oxidoreductase RutF